MGLCAQKRVRLDLIHLFYLYLLLDRPRTRKYVLPSCGQSSEYCIAAIYFRQQSNWWVRPKSHQPVVYWQSICFKMHLFLNYKKIFLKKFFLYRLSVRRLGSLTPINSYDVQIWQFQQFIFHFGNPTFLCVRQKSMH